MITRGALGLPVFRLARPLRDLGSPTRPRAHPGEPYAAPCAPWGALRGPVHPGEPYAAPCTLGSPTRPRAPWRALRCPVHPGAPRTRPAHPRTPPKSARVAGHDRNSSPPVLPHESTRSVRSHRVARRIVPVPPRMAPYGPVWPRNGAVRPRPTSSDSLRGVGHA